MLWKIGLVLGLGVLAWYLWSQRRPLTPGAFHRRAPFERLMALRRPTLLGALALIILLCLGTVWGIIDAFHGLGTAGAATLRAVAPGISEALITTAAGLAAAIPAVIAYNLIGSSIREFAARGDDFSLEMLNAVERSAAQVAYQGEAAGARR